MNPNNLKFNFWYESYIFDYLFEVACNERNIKTTFKTGYSTADPFCGKPGVIKEFKIIKEEVQDESHSTRYDALCTFKDIPIFLGLSSTYFWTRVGSSDKKVIEKIIKIVKKYFPERQRVEKDSYDMKFWYAGPNGPKCRPREFSEQSLAEITDNYNEEDKSKIEFLKKYKPSKGGELLLLTGEAGVGKSSLLLSLFREWKSWATFNYIMDTHNFLGGHPSYVMDLVLKEDDELEDGPEDMPTPRYSKKINWAKSILGASGPSPTTAHSKKWKIFILEDCGEILGVDAKQKIGQALSMFLNITDGFVGRGTKTIIILTTNEDVGKLHPAVSRPGRCAFNHKFGRLSKEESKEWFVKKGRKELAENVKGDMTIAELYATLNNKLNNLEQKTHSVGFLGE